MTKTIELNCLQCSKPFQARPTDIRRGHARYCSRSCCAKYNVRLAFHEPNTNCAYCDKKFWCRNAINKYGSKSGLRFCCREHKDLAQRIGGIEAIQPAHYKGSPESSDYRVKAFRLLPYKCNRCNYDQKRILVVHHIDHDRSNNDISNLEILCPNCHAIEHWFPDQK